MDVKLNLVNTIQSNAQELNAISTDSFNAIAEAVSGIRKQYMNTSEDICTISNLITELTQGANLVSSSSDQLIAVVTELSAD